MRKGTLLAKNVVLSRAFIVKGQLAPLNSSLYLPLRWTIYCKSYRISLVGSKAFILQRIRSVTWPLTVWWHKVTSVDFLFQTKIWQNFFATPIKFSPGCLCHTDVKNHVVILWIKVKNKSRKTMLPFLISSEEFTKVICYWIGTVHLIWIQSQPKILLIWSHSLKVLSHILQPEQSGCQDWIPGRAHQ